MTVLASRFAALGDNARAFMGSLQRTIDLHDVEEEVFLAVHGAGTPPINGLASRPTGRGTV
ncbi:hypothetical protein ACIBJF_46440 [Streptomyces sp. NPDC050743]|uniref:hypothetical protein n=1 Tax=Streptomyces sp. NPDC050743 TaxID=3365634 RepID=UPI00378E15E9